MCQSVVRNNCNSSWILPCLLWEPEESPGVWLDWKAQSWWVKQHVERASINTQKLHLEVSLSNDVCIPKVAVTNCNQPLNVSSPPIWKSKPVLDAGTVNWICKFYLINSRGCRHSFTPALAFSATQFFILASGVNPSPLPQTTYSFSLQPPPTSYWTQILSYWISADLELNYILFWATEKSEEKAGLLVCNDFWLLNHTYNVNGSSTPEIKLPVSSLAHRAYHPAT